MSAYVIVDIEIHDPVRYEDYKKLVSPTIAAHGGRYLARGGKTVVLEGTFSPKRAVILEFDTVEAARGWWDAPDYAEAKRLRQEIATTNAVIIEGL